MSKANEALDRMAENARELGLDYEPQKRPQNCGTGYCSCIECVMEPAQQEPMHPEIKKMYEDYFDKCFRESSIAERTWVGLSDAEIHNMTILMGFNPEWVPEVEMVKSIVRNLEAKLKEKNNG